VAITISNCYQKEKANGRPKELKRATLQVKEYQKQISPKEEVVKAAEEAARRVTAT
jgi:hypothetical protein